jgi:N-acylneuraminate cytidylyltransferase
LIVIIPARGGSKRILNKNRNLFNGIPIIIQVINILKSINEISRIVVSTDDPEIITLVSNEGIEVPFKRPSTLSDDLTGTLPVIKHAISELNLKEDQILACVYPTNIFINQEIVLKAQNSAISNSNSMTFTVKKYDHPIQRAFTLNNKNEVVLDLDSKLESRTQDLKDYFHDAGQIYAARTATWQRLDQIITSGSVALDISDHLHVDIDYPEDWAKAEQIYKLIEKKDYR